MLGVAGCEFPVSSSKYHVVETETPAGTEGERSPELDADVQRLVDTFAGGDTRCARSFANACAVALAECGAHAECIEYAECMRERANPTSETTCSDDHQTSLDDSWHFELLRHCWATRYAECKLGNDFSCTGEYGPASGERTNVEIRQQLLVRGAENTQAKFSVAFCQEWTDCTEPALETTSDATTGLYDATLAVGGKNFGVGNDWNGYRLIRGMDIPDSIVAANVPIWGRRLEITRLLDDTQVSLLAAFFGIDATRSVFVQIVDCQSDPAAGITFDVPTSPTATVGYVDEAGNQVSGPTVASGAAGITDYDPEQPQTIRALRGGEVIATWNGDVSAGTPRYLRLHPVGKQ